MDKMQQWLDAKSKERSPWGAMACTQRLLDRVVHGLLACRAQLLHAPEWQAALDILATRPVIVHAVLPGHDERLLHADSHALWISEVTVAALLESGLLSPSSWQQPFGSRRAPWDVPRGIQGSLPHLTFDPLSTALLAQAHRCLSGTSVSFQEKHGRRPWPARSLRHATPILPAAAWNRDLRAAGLPVSPTRPKVREFQRSSLAWLRAHAPHLMSWAGDKVGAQALRATSPWADVTVEHPLYRHAWCRSVWRAMKECRPKDAWKEAYQFHALGAWAMPEWAGDAEEMLLPWSWRDFTQHHIETSATLLHHEQVDHVLGRPRPRPHDPRLSWVEGLWWLKVYHHALGETPSSPLLSFWMRPRDEGAQPPSSWIFGRHGLPSWGEGQVHALVQQPIPWPRLSWHGLATEEAAHVVLDKGVLPHQRQSPQASTLLDVVMHQGWSAELFEKALSSASDLPEHRWRRHGLMKHMPGTTLSVVVKSTPLLGQATRGSHVRGLLTRFPGLRHQAASAMKGVFPITSHLSGVYRELLSADPHALSHPQQPHWLVHVMKQQASAKPGHLCHLSRTGLFALVRWMRAAPAWAVPDFPWSELWGCAWLHHPRLWIQPRYQRVIRTLVEAANQGRWEGDAWDVVFLSAARRAPRSPLLDALRGWKNAWEHGILNQAMSETPLKNGVSRERI